MAAELERVLAELVLREPLFHRRQLVHSAGSFDAETAEDYWEVGASGRTYSRAFVREVVLRRVVESAVDPCDREGWTLEDHCLRQLGPETYLLTYVLNGQGRRTRRATIWRWSSEKGWHALYHQGTPYQQGTTATSGEGTRQMKVRTATYVEVDEIQRLMYATIDASYVGHYPPRAIPLFKAYHSTERIRQRMSDGWFVVVEDSDALVATGTLVGEEIFAVFVSPSRQGLGIGRMVMDALEGRARENGLDRVRLDASLPSTGFYVGRGYRLLERCSMDAGEGQSLDWWKAEKTLTR